MIHDRHPWFAQSRPFLPPSLLAHQQAEQLAQLLSPMPHRALVALEFHLTHPGEPVDCSIRLTAREDAERVLELIDSPVTTTFLETWVQTQRFANRVPRLWLEFDLNRGQEGFRDPVLCAEISKALAVCERAAASWLVDELVPCLHGEELSSSHRTTALAALKALQGRHRLLYIFSLRARRSKTIRLEIVSDSVSNLLPYLDIVGGSPSVAQVNALGDLLDDAQRPHLSFEIGDRGLGPRIGLEVARIGLPRRDPSWRRLFDRLVHHQLCSTAASDALLSWSGYLSWRDRPTGWPQLAGRPVAGACIRSLSHVKLVTWPDQPPEAKAYLLIEHWKRLRQGAQLPSSL